MRIFFLLLVFFFSQVKMNSQQDSLSPKNLKTRKLVLGIGSAALTSGSLVYLNQAWYKNYNTGKFHTFNDNDEWNQMDKCGHAFTTFQLGRMMMDAFDWAGFDRKTKLWVAGGAGLYYMTAIEFMDGFSDGWGFSFGDMGANVGGAALAISQEALWKQQRISLKFQYAESGLAKYNPNLLGDSWYTQMLKDYNGQTYWLSINPTSFFKNTGKFPKWLNIAFGYSSYGMISARTDLYFFHENGKYYMWEKERRYYVSLDIDLTRIKTKSKFLKAVFSAFSMIKIPAPALQFSKKGVKGYGIYL
jgi:hypothetical protein